MTERLTYAGIGARSTPDHIIASMTAAASSLESMGLVLQSGGAAGADWAFQVGVTDPANQHIMLPWYGYNSMYPAMMVHLPDEAFDIAKQYHPNWNNLTHVVQKFMARNVQILLGEHLNQPVKFVICWTKGGKTIGGTGHSIRVANGYQIPIFNLGDPNVSLTNVESKITSIIQT